MEINPHQLKLMVMNMSGHAVADDLMQKAVKEANSLDKPLEFITLPPREGVIGYKLDKQG